MNKNKLNQIIIFLFLILPLLSNGQGWEKTYDGGSDENVYAADRTLDGGVIMAGSQTDNANGIEHSFLYKTDSNGNLQWEYYDSTHIGTFVNTLEVLSTSDGNFLLSSLYGNNPPNNDAVVQKIAPGGTVLWENSLSSPYLDYVRHIGETPDGGYIFLGLYSTPQIINNLGVVKVDSDGSLVWEISFEDFNRPYQPGGVTVASNGDIIVSGYLGYFDSTQDAFVKRIDGNGDVIWEQEYNLATNDFSFEVVELSNGDFVVAGSASENFLLSTASLMKISSEGGLIWYHTYPSLGDQIISGVQKTNDGGFVIGGRHEDVNANDFNDFYLLKTDSEGNEVWSKNYGRSKDDNAYGLMAATDGGFYLAGFTQNNDDSYDAYLVKTDSLGNSFTNELSGNLFHDENIDCLLDANEDGMSQWLIMAENTNAQHLTLTDSLGNYSLLLDSGSYQITTTPISPYWTLCDTTFDINFVGFAQSIVNDIPAQTEIDCPLLDVSISTPFLRRCFENYYSVQYCNYGTEIAEDAYVEITLDPFMEVSSTSLPIESIDGLNYTFNLGDVGVGECGTFSLNVLLGNPTNCDSIPLGATHCVEAHIYPDSICMPSGNWSGASVEVDALCNGDTVSFRITNVGTAATQPNLVYLVVEDDVVLYEGSFSLDPNESEDIFVPTNGSTFRLEVQQEPNHPGMSMPSISVENCGAENNIFSFGFINIFAQDDGDPFVDIDCQNNIGAFDPNDKRGFPLGYGDENYINRGQDIEYMIRFQNTGTDTAFNVVIKDELSELLDIRTLRPGASSHPYEFNISGNNMLSFTFDNIMLPDSNINEPASHGFVKFKVAQQPNLPLETQIHNSAGIYFDFNAPIITNQTLHTIGEDLISVSIDNIENQLADVKIYPNPFTDFVNIEVKDLKITDGQFKLFDATGRLLRRQNFDNNVFTFYKKDLRTGIYFFTIENNGQLISSGKLIAQ